MRLPSPTCLSAVAIAVFLISPAGVPAGEQQPSATSPEAAVRASAEAFAEAFDKGDAAAVANFWTAEGSLIDASGDVLQGRQAIEAQYAALFKKYPGARIEIAVARVEFPTPTMAIEDGFARVLVDSADTAGVGRYTAVHVLEDGRWRMAGVRESSLPPPSGKAHMDDLAWLIGTWQGKSDRGTARWTFRWIVEKRFIQRNYTAEKDGEPASSGIEIIGWDPQRRQVRSWSFDSSGGHRTAVWTATPEGWRIRCDGVLADGTPTSSRDVLRRVPPSQNEDGIGWRSVDRTTASVQLSDIPETVLRRLPPESPASAPAAD